ncbi:MAG TPA: hypothetical protein VGO68_14415 [Pyrinomonadaceae bacterium]|nr:hypothetical protein [Pyrinomonadaceae bacterium]
MASLSGKVALVAGATRGAGRGIAVQLGAAGATVYVTGMASRFRVGSWPKFMASLILTGANRTPGGISPKFRTQANRPT